MSQSRHKFKTPTHVFHTEWQGLNEFRYWLAPVDGDKTKAWCNACKRKIRASLKVLQVHSISETHTNKMVTYGRIPNEDYSQALKDNKINKSITESATIEFQPSEEIITSEMGTQSQNGKFVVVLLNENDYENEGPHTSSHIQKEVNTIGKTGNLVSVVTENYVQKNKVGIQSKEYHSSTYYGKMDHKHGDVCGKAIVSKPAPFWIATAVVNGQITELNLKDYKGCYLVLFFYPRNFSRICPTEILALSHRISEFRALNTEIVACSVDSYFSHQAWSKLLQSDGRIAKFPLLSDPTHAISKSYGCYLPDLGHSLRAHYIIDMRGILRHVTINDLSVGRNISEILRLLEAFQYTDETERVCLADWKPDKPTLS